MRKRFLSLIMAAIFIFSICGAAYADDAETYGRSTGTPVVVLAQYALRPSYSSYTYSFYIIQNTGNRTIDVTASSESFAPDGRMVATGDSRLYALGPGCISLIYNAFQTDELVTKALTSWKTNGSSYQSVIQNLSYNMTPEDGGVVFEVTNNGTVTAESVEGFALFFLGGSLVDYNWTFFNGEDGKLNPGQTIEKEMTTPEIFDSVQFYLTGRGNR